MPDLGGSIRDLIDAAVQPVTPQVVAARGSRHRRRRRGMAITFAAALVIVGVASAVAVASSSPTRSVVAGTRGSTYTATNVVVSKPIGRNVNPAINYDRLAIIASSGEVPKNAAETLGLMAPQPFQPTAEPRLGQTTPSETGFARGVAMEPVSVVITPNQITGSLTITATAPTAKLAAASANALATELIIYLNPPAIFDPPPATSYEPRLDSLQAQHRAALLQVVDLRAQRVVATGQGTSPARIDAQLRQAENRLVDVDRQLLQLTQSPESTSPVVSLIVATPTNTRVGPPVPAPRRG